MPTQPLKILLVIETGGGGSGRHFIDLAAALVDRGMCVHAVYSPTRAETAFVAQLRAIRDLTIEVLPMRRSLHPADMRALVWLSAYIRRHDFDVVHGHSSKAGALARVASLFARARRIYTPHALVTMSPQLGGVGRAAYGFIERLLGIIGTDTLIAVSDDELHHALRLGIPASKMSMVKNGVEPSSRDAIQRRRSSVRMQYKIQHEEVVVGWVGRMSWQKAPERFVALARQLADQSVNVRFMMLGDGELANTVDAQIRASGLKGRFLRIAGARGVDFMPAFDIQVMTSRFEAMSYVLIEALDAGLPLVAMDVGGASTIIDQGKNGFIVPNSDISDALGHSIKLLVEDAALRDSMGEHSLGKSRHFHLEQMIRDTLAAYGRVADRPNGRSALCDRARVGLEPRASLTED